VSYRLSTTLHGFLQVTNLTVTTFLTFDVQIRL